MSLDNLEHNLIAVKRSLKKRKIWNLGYLEEMVRNQLQMEANELSNSGKDYPMVKYLLRRGFTPSSIVMEAKRIRNIIRDHQTYLAKVNDAKRKGKHKKHKTKKAKGE